MPRRRLNGDGLKDVEDHLLSSRRSWTETVQTHRAERAKAVPADDIVQINNGVHGPTALTARDERLCKECASAKSGNLACSEHGIDTEAALFSSALKQAAEMPLLWDIPLHESCCHSRSAACFSHCAGLARHLSYRRASRSRSAPRTGMHDDSSPPALTYTIGQCCPWIPRTRPQRVTLVIVICTFTLERKDRCAYQSSHGWSLCSASG